MMGDLTDLYNTLIGKDLSMADAVAIGLDTVKLTLPKIKADEKDNWFHDNFNSYHLSMLCPCWDV